MASPDDIRAIRALQRQYGAAGDSISFADAKKLVQNPAPESQQQRDLDWLNKAIAQTQAKLDDLKSEVERIRITGPGFSGQGTRGIVFVPTAEMGDGGGAGALTLVALSSDGTDISAVEVSVTGSVIGPFEP